MITLHRRTIVNTNKTHLEREWSGPSALPNVLPA
jgi:hypothetical protein